MKLRDVVSHIFIDPRKLTTYALSLESLRGRDKAILFQTYLGFTQENYQLLLEQVQAKVMDSEAIPVDLDEYGQRYRVDVPIIGVEPGQQEIVRTGWIVKSGEEGLARLTTLYIRRQK